MRRVCLLFGLSVLIVGGLPTGAQPSPEIYALAAGLPAQGNDFADSAFQRLWQRTDLPVAQGRVARTWLWGPAPRETRTGTQMVAGRGPLPRTEQYFDKSRMEINLEVSDPANAWHVTNGLLAVELISGMTGDPVNTYRLPLAALRTQTTMPWRSPQARRLPALSIGMARYRPQPRCRAYLSPRIYGKPGTISPNRSGTLCTVRAWYTREGLIATDP